MRDGVYTTALISSPIPWGADAVARERNGAMPN